MIDLDHNAGTGLDPRVAAAIVELSSRTDLGNPSSLHRRGQAARAVIERARRRVAAAVGSEPLEVTFTAGGTEADALAVLGIARARRDAGEPATVVTSPIEHPAILGAVARLAAQGHRVTMVQPDPAGRIDADALAHALRQAGEVGLVSLSAANHELGNAYDVAALAAVVRELAPGAAMHVDAVQAFGKVVVDRRAWGVDALSISAHKVHGLAGVGALVHRQDLSVQSLVGAGHHERGRRPGTEALLSIHAFGVAAQLAAEQQPQTLQHVSALRERVLTGVQALGGRVHGDPIAHVGNTITVAFDGVDGQLLMINLDLEGIAVSTGAACDAGAAEPSAVLRALGLHEDARASIRISVGRSNTTADVDALLAALPAIVQRVRQARAS